MGNQFFRSCNDEREVRERRKKIGQLAELDQYRSYVEIATILVVISELNAWLNRIWRGQGSLLPPADLFEEMAETKRGFFGRAERITLRRVERGKNPQLAKYA